MMSKLVNMMFKLVNMMSNFGKFRYFLWSIGMIFGETVVGLDDLDGPWSWYIGILRKWRVKRIKQPSGVVVHITVFITTQAVEKMIQCWFIWMCVKTLYPWWTSK